jgi:integrase/recombinase XerC/integrase/recombinase XerD
MNRFLKYLNGKPLDKVTLSTLEGYVGVHMHAQGFAPTTRNVAIFCLRGFYAWAARVEVIVPNPAIHLEKLKIGQKLPPLMGLENAEALLNAPDITTFKGLRDCAILHVLVGTGCRVSGITNLNQNDLIWYKNDKGQERMAIRLKEKGKKERVVPCPMEVGLIVRAYLGHPHLDTIDRSFGKEGHQVLFVNIVGRVKACDHVGERFRLTAHSVQRIMLGYCEQVGTPQEFRHPHAFRHLFATELRENGTDLQEIAALLGHASIETTKIYSHLAFRRMSSIIDLSNPMNRIKSPVSELAERLGIS